MRYTVSVIHFWVRATAVVILHGAIQIVKLSVCVCMTDLLFDGEVIFAVSLEFSAFVWLEFA